MSGKHYNQYLFEISRYWTKSRSRRSHTAI